MIRYTSYVSIILCVVILAACYNDDTAPPATPRLPFENFDEFFQSNNDRSLATVQLGAPNTLFLSPNDNTILIPEDAFDVVGNNTIEVKEAFTKSDFLLRDKPTIVDNNLIETIGAIFFNPSAGNQTTLNNEVRVEMKLPTGDDGEDMEYFYYENGWTTDNAILVTPDNDFVNYETTRTGWQMTGRMYNNIGTAQLIVKPFAFASIPHDMRVFVVFSNKNIILPLDHDVAEVMANGSIPTGESAHVVVMLMDHFKLTVGIEELVLGEDTEVEVEMDAMSFEDMENLIKTLD